MMSSFYQDSKNPDDFFGAFHCHARFAVGCQFAHAQKACAACIHNHVLLLTTAKAFLIEVHVPVA